jgi:NAD-dependent dihydropyrimidine dehydrogenase PreA subunit
MKFEINKSKCAGCGACLRACPYGAIEIGKDGKAFIHQDKCKKCGKCQRICPFNAIREISNEADKKNVEQSNNPTSPAATPFPYMPPSSGEKRFGMGKGRGMGAGRGRGFGRGPRDGRGGGRGGGGILY